MYMYMYIESLAFGKGCRRTPISLLLNTDDNGDTETDLLVSSGNN